MDAIRSSLILSIGERAGEIASRVQDFTEKRWPALEPVVAYVNLASDGTVTRRSRGEQQPLVSLKGLAYDEEAGAYRSNFELLCGELAEPIAHVVDEVLRDVRLKDTLVKLRTQLGLADSGRIYLHVLADSFGPVASTLPLALLKILEERGMLGWAGRFPISMNLLYFLPGLFATKADDHRICRSHATFSELESFLYPVDYHSRRTPPSCKVWVVGSIDRGGATVHDFSSLVSPTAQFLSRLIDGSLEGDTSWETELGREVEERRTFLSSFGFADLYFPRAFLQKLAREVGRRQLCDHLTAGRTAVDPDAVSADVQSWIAHVRLGHVVRRLQSPHEGQLVFNEPTQPSFSPSDLQTASYEQEVEKRLVEDLQLGGTVQRVGNALFEAHYQQFLDQIDELLDERPGGLPEVWEFCEHLHGVGRGLTEALIGQDVRNLESLILDLQTYFHREAGLPGDPAREKELKTVLMPGKVEAINDSAERLKEDERHLRELFPEHKGRVNERTSDESAETGTAAQEEPPKSSRKEGGAAEYGSREEAQTGAEPEANPDTPLGLSMGDEGRAQLEARIVAERQDLEQYKKELEDLRKEHEAQEKNIRRSRQLARDPARRHQLLSKLRAAEQESLEEDTESLRTATANRLQARERWKDERSQLWRTLVIRMGAIPLAVGVSAFAIYIAAAAQVAELPFSSITATGAAMAALALTSLLGILPTLRKWWSCRGASHAYQAALREVRKLADRLWGRRVAGLRRRFDFLIHAEAIRILDRLQDEVLTESSRIKTLAEGLGEYREMADRAIAEAAMDSSLYHRPVLQSDQAHELVRENKVLEQSIQEVIEEVTLSRLLQSARSGESGAGMPPLIVDTEATVDLRCAEILSAEHVGTVLDRALHAGEEAKLHDLWLSVQEAAVSWISIKEAGTQGVLRNLLLAPNELSDTMQTFLRGRSASESSAALRASGDRDQIGACETWVAFSTHQIAELTMIKEKLDQHWAAVSAVKGTIPLSLPRDQVVTSVSQEDTYALLQAALAFLKHSNRLGPRGKTPEEWLQQFRAADEFPKESSAELRDQLNSMRDSVKGAAARFQRFLQGLPSRERRLMEHLLH